LPAARRWRRRWPAARTSTSRHMRARLDPDGELRPGVERVVGPAHRFAVELDPLDVVGERAEQALRFERGEHLTRAGMDADAEADVPARVAADVEPVGILEPPRVAVGGAEQREHLAAR